MTIGVELTVNKCWAIIDLESGYIRFRLRSVLLIQANPKILLHGLPKGVSYLLTNI